ncbi:2-dehydropantoate 2-reductase [Xaviernesmea oryzae]|uniref:2-dehydropantoate 2-reductase n=1 Tax=Xaviernesmea oryzae TaxID=464029 RepID=A0A1X7G1S7_9HYPH|nr:2-dehydropantoate 2-reductase [Xaviernesmea oryzae]SMF62455.1 2-dehydropantoate 2-reductase [Xaviernesmea oryzae]
MSGKILIWGAGAIGGAVGAYLWKAGHEVAFVDASAAHVEAINRDGLSIVGPVSEFTAHAPAFLPDEITDEWPIVALAVKAQHTKAACRQLLPRLAPDGYVLSLQNGLCEVVIEGLAGRSRTMGALVGFMGDQLGPGVVRFGQRAKFCVGELDGRITDRATALGAMLRDFEPDVEVTDDIWGYLWGKLTFIALLYGTSLGTSKLHELFASEALLPVWRELASEMVAVAVSEGVVARGFDGLEPASFAAGASLEQARRSMQAMAAPLVNSAKTHSGIWRDIAVHKRQTEIDNQIGPVLQIAARNRIKVPALTRLVGMIHAVERQQIAQSDALIPGLIEQPTARTSAWGRAL